MIIKIMKCIIMMITSIHWLFCPNHCATHFQGVAWLSSPKHTVFAFYEWEAQLLRGIQNLGCYQIHTSYLSPLQNHQYTVITLFPPQLLEPCHTKFLLTVTWAYSIPKWPWMAWTPPLHLLNGRQLALRIDTYTSILLLRLFNSAYHCPFFFPLFPPKANFTRKTM